MATIETGTRVHWTQMGSGRKSFSMTRREGVVEHIDESGTAYVRTHRKRLVAVPVARLAIDGQPTEIDIVAPALLRP